MKFAGNSLINSLVLRAGSTKSHDFIGFLNVVAKKFPADFPDTREFVHG